MGGAEAVCDEPLRAGIGGGTTLEDAVIEGASEVVRRGRLGAVGATYTGFGATGCPLGAKEDFGLPV